MKEETPESIETRVSRMPVEEARKLRDELDSTPISQLPGASEIGTSRAIRAADLFRSVLTARIGDGK